MRSPNRKAPAGTEASHSNTLAQKHTSPRGRRAIVHLWTASRAVAGASLTKDDTALILEALAEIQGVLK